MANNAPFGFYDEQAAVERERQAALENEAIAQDLRDVANRPLNVNAFMEMDDDDRRRFRDVGRNEGAADDDDDALANNLENDLGDFQQDIEEDDEPNDDTDFRKDRREDFPTLIEPNHDTTWKVVGRLDGHKNDMEYVVSKKLSWGAISHKIAKTLGVAQKYILLFTVDDTQLDEKLQMQPEIAVFVVRVMGKMSKSVEKTLVSRLPQLANGEINLDNVDLDNLPAIYEE